MLFSDICGERARAAVGGKDLFHHQFGLGVKQWFLQTVRKTVGRWIPGSDTQKRRTSFQVQILCHSIFNHNLSAMLP